MRAFTIDNNGSEINLQVQQPTAGTWVNKFLNLPNSQVFCGLENGKFLIWDLNSNSTMDDFGHGPGRAISDIV